MFITAFLSVAGIGFICWLLFNLAVYALPFFAGVSAGMFAYQTGSGPIGALLVGFIAGAITLVLGQVLFATIRSAALRAIVALAYAAPAALAEYHAVHGLSAFGGTSEIWRQVFAAIGAVVIAGVAWARVSAFYPGQTERGLAPACLPSVGLGGAANDR
jgi:hypothetical protein